MNTKEQILNYVVSRTELLLNDDFALLTTSAISEALHLSRSLVSQNLNVLFKEGQLVKISTRPVVYFDKKSFEQVYEITLEEQEYFSFEDLNYEVLDKSKDDIFQHVIGLDGSLNNAISQIKSSLKYPGKKMPIVLQGKNGAGKSYLVSLIHKYLCTKELISSGKSYKRLKYLDEESFIGRLFGTDKKEGILENKTVGFVYIEDLEEMSDQVQYRLAQMLTNGYYIKEGKTIVVDCYFAFSTSNIKRIEYTLTQNLPVITDIPSLSQRGMEEKEKLIIHFFKQEQVNLRRKIKVSSGLMEALLKLKFDDDIHVLERTITQICISSLAEDSEDSALTCYLYHLPDTNVLLPVNRSMMKQNESLISVDQYEFNDSMDKIITVFTNILDQYQNFIRNEITLSSMFENINISVRQYYDLIIYNETYNEPHQKMIENLIENTIHQVKLRYDVQLSGNYPYVLSKLLLSSIRSSNKIGNWIDENSVEIDRMYAYLKTELYQHQLIAEEIATNLYQNIEMRMDKMDLIFLILNLRFYNDSLKGKEVGAVIISHGYSTASSIADAANQLLGKHIFDAFDMPLDSSTHEIIEKVNNYISMNLYLKSLIILVDMGSLELIGERLQGDLNVGVINNISTAIALNIGNMLSKDMDMEDILDKAAKDSVTRYQILAREAKEEAILFVSDAGVNISNRMMNLFNHSLPKSIALQTISYDHKKLLLNGENDEVFQKYNVVLLVKPKSLHIDRFQSVSLEEMINYTDISAVNSALMKYLTKDEIEIFNHNIIKNFSLENVVENLTILNPNNLMDFISDAIAQLQRKMNKKFLNKTLIGIYIHVSFLIERLVTKTAIDSVETDVLFEETEAEFISFVNESFEGVLKHYNVQLPIGEIILLHNYIVNDFEESDDDFNED